MFNKTSDMFMAVHWEDKKYIVNLSENANWNYIYLKKDNIVFEFGPDVDGTRKSYQGCTIYKMTEGNLRAALDWLRRGKDWK